VGSAYAFSIFTAQPELEAAIKGPAFVVVSVLLIYLLVINYLLFGIRLGRRFWWRVGHKPPEIEPELKQRLQNLGNHVQALMSPTLPVKFFVGRMSYNAFTAKRGIVIGEKILRHSTDEEVEAIIAHELAHTVNNDRWKRQLLIIAGLVPVLAVVFSSFTRSSIILAGTLWSVLVFLSIPFNWKIEYDADLKAARYIGFGAMTRSLEMLQAKLYGSISFTHPPLAKRIERLRSKETLSAALQKDN